MGDDHAVPLELFAVRHGESGWNASGRMQGQSLDAPGLTARGRRQAARAADELRSCRAELLVTSDLLRARETAAPIGELLGVPLLVDVRLRERSLGAREGGPAVDTPDLGVDGERVLDPQARPAGGESLADLYDRVAGFLASLGARPARRVVCVTHGGVVRVLHALHEGRGPDSMGWPDVGNAAVTRLSFAVAPPG